jgi:hypothetical protein
VIHILKHLSLVGLIALVAWSWSRYQVDSSPYDFDEADYMFAASRGFLANWSDSPSLSLPACVRIGLSRGSDPSQRDDLSVLLRDSGDMNVYRHWEGTLYYDGLALIPAGSSEHAVRELSMVASLLALTVIYLGCLWLWPEEKWGPLGILAGIIASLLFLWCPAVVKTTVVAPHLLFAAVCLAALFATAKFRETGKRSHWYAALVLSGVAFCTMHVAFALILTVLICGYLERDRLICADDSRARVRLIWQSLVALVSPILLLWPASLYKLTFLKSYLAMAYLALFRKDAWDNVTLAEIWSFRVRVMPVEWAALGLALILFFLLPDLPGRRQMSVFLIFGLVMVAALFRVNAINLRYVLPFFPALMVFTGCVLAAAINHLQAPVRFTLAVLLTVLVFLDTSRQVNARPLEPIAQRLALLDAVRDPRWAGRTLLVPQKDVPTLHFYFQGVTFRGYKDVSVIPARLSAQHFDGVIYPDGASVRVP